MGKQARTSFNSGSRHHTRTRIWLSILFLLLVPLLAGAASTPQSGAWWAEYFDNQTLSGSPVLTRFDDTVSFNWGGGSPGPGVPADGFSARWTREEWFENGTYRFSASSDDGMRVWVGDLLVVDVWYDQEGGWLTRDVYVNRGTYPVRVEYYEHAGAARVYLSWERVTGGQGWRAEYFDNQKLEGSPVFIRTDPAIDFAWDYGSPDPAIPDDHFSVRWSHTLGFSPGTYRFFTSTDDGVRLWVDGWLVVDAWHKQKLPNTHSGDLALDEGPHQITVEYFEQGGEAHAHAWWKRLNGFVGWKGEYFDNRDLVGGPALVRDDAEINFDWGVAPPVAWMPDDNFAARWSRELTFDPGYYRLSVRADDGVRVWLDDALIIDKWHEMNNELHYVDGMYLSGSHRLKVEYFEQNGQARIHFWINSGTGVAPAPSPTPDPPPTPAVPASQAPWQASYFANSTLRGEPTLVRQDPAIDFDWGWGAPDPALRDDIFSVRWGATQTFSAGRYRFITYTDDGVRLLVDGQTVIESWRPMRGYRSALVNLTEGPHTLVMEYFERTGVALAHLSWARVGSPPPPTLPSPPGAPGPWQAEYFDNQDLSGEPLLTQTHERLDFNWGFGGPSPAMPRDDFAIRWTTRRAFESGRYTFTTYSDDGVRLYVDGRRVLDSWRPMRGYRSVTLDLSAGEHTIVLEYFEERGIALVWLNWRQ
jgi:hypothetical protein